MAMEEKTEKATPKKRRESRKKGQVVRSQDLSSALLLLGIFGTLKVCGGFCVSVLEDLIAKFLTNFSVASEPLTITSISKLFLEAVVSLALASAPILLASVIVATLASYLQVGFLSTTETLTPKLEKINPIAGFKRLFSMRSVVEMIKSILKFIVLSYILYKQIYKDFPRFPTLISSSFEVSVSYMVELTMNIAFKLGLALLIIGVADYLYQWWQHEKELMMSKQEVKDEYKTTEGDPNIKGKIKQKQLQMSMLRMMSDVAKADFVITNPTHYAIAIMYDEKVSSAPIVLAKGKDFVAQKIKEKAKENEIEMIENRPLAQALYVAVDIGEQIPPEFYAAVAEILVKIYSIKR